MSYKKRTTVDFSGHQLQVTQCEKILIHRFAKPGSSTYAVTFINACGILAVTGDLGNWIFCREFHPAPGNYVDDQYWCGKLQIHSEQSSEDFSSDLTRQALYDGIKNGLEDSGYEGKQLREAKQYYNDLLEWVDYPEYEYLEYAKSNRPEFMDYDEIPHEKEIKPRLRMIFDAFDEICTLLKADAEKLQEAQS